MTLSPVTAELIGHIIDLERRLQALAEENQSLKLALVGNPPISSNGGTPKTERPVWTDTAAQT
jgi:hypothetical protein